MGISTRLLHYALMSMGAGFMGHINSITPNEYFLQPRKHLNQRQRRKSKRQQPHGKK